MQIGTEAGRSVGGGFVLVAGIPPQALVNKAPQPLFGFLAAAADRLRWPDAVVDRAFRHQRGDAARTNLRVETWDGAEIRMRDANRRDRLEVLGQQAMDFRPDGVGGVRPRPDAGGRDHTTRFHGVRRNAQFIWTRVERGRIVVGYEGCGVSEYAGGDDLGPFACVMEHMSDSQFSQGGRKAWNGFQREGMTPVVVVRM